MQTTFNNKKTELLNGECCIQHSTFNIQHSTFNNNIQHSTFNIQHSTFNIQHSTFNIQGFLRLEILVCSKKGGIRN